MMIRDGDWTLVQSDLKLGRYIWATRDERGREVYRVDYHVDQTVNDNKAFRNMLSPGWKGDWHRVASLPPAIAYGDFAEAMKQDDQKWVSKFLNDGDNAAWRTKEGTV